MPLIFPRRSSATWGAVPPKDWHGDDGSVAWRNLAGGEVRLWIREVDDAPGASPCLRDDLRNLVGAAGGAELDDDGAHVPLPLLRRVAGTRGSRGSSLSPRGYGRDSGTCRLSAENLLPPAYALSIVEIYAHPLGYDLLVRRGGVPRAQ